ncbi:hypothetical protein [Prescottella sp. R16]|uniref:hypothetical protein n=1 Tax=Prescottella sp. R16 TaxID=3064529 RepID=UPI00272E433D|nr:hypothetical protein [Prescottella sp. R16]
MWFELTKTLAPIVAALIAGGIALYINNRNVKTISDNADKSIAAAEVNADRSIEAAAANVASSVRASADGVDKTILAAEERERRNWIREQTVDAAAAILTAATELDTRVDRATKTSVAFARSWDGPESARERLVQENPPPIDLVLEVEEALAALNRAIDLFQFVADEEPCYAAQMLRWTYQQLMVQIRFLEEFANGYVAESVHVQDNESPTAAEAAHCSRDAVKAYKHRTLHEREVLLHHVRNALGLPPICLDAFTLTIPDGVHGQLR